MMIIDAQVHAYERDRPERPWHAVLVGPAEVTGEQMVAAMDAVGVDGAILVSPFTMYRYDASYALDTHGRHPGRFALVKPVDPADHFAASGTPTTNRFGPFSGTSFVDAVPSNRTGCARPGV